MKYLTNGEEKTALYYLAEATRIALNSTCERAQCGSVIVQNNQIIGMGFNSPPQNEQKRCAYSKDLYHKKVTDKTCCVHAEQRAIMDGLKNYSDQIIGSRLYFVRLNNTGTASRSGKPYCTICSKMALDAGITEFVLWHEDGVCVYDTYEYNDLSFQYTD